MKMGRFCLEEKKGSGMKKKKFSIILSLMERLPLIILLLSITAICIETTIKGPGWEQKTPSKSVVRSR